MNKIPYDEKSIDLKIKKIIDSLLGKNKDDSDTNLAEYINAKLSNKDHKYKVFLRNQDYLESNFQLNNSADNLQFKPIQFIYQNQINNHCNFNKIFDFKYRCLLKNVKF